MGGKKLQGNTAILLIAVPNYNTTLRETERHAYRGNESHKQACTRVWSSRWKPNGALARNASYTVFQSIAEQTHNKQNKKKKQSVGTKAFLLNVFY